MSSRRQLLASLATAVGVAVAGCTGGETMTDPATTRTTTREATSDLSTDCQSLPDIDGLPTPPAEWGLDSTRSYVTEFERAFKPVRDDSVAEVTDVQVTDATESGDRYTVELDVEVEKAAAGGTRTEQPPDASEYGARYVVTPERIVREKRGVAGGRLLSEHCWWNPTTGER